jgi:hypothetical protein
MSTVLYELPDRYVLDTGEVVGKHVAAMRLILAGKPLEGQLFLDSEDMQRLAASGTALNLWAGDGEEANPDPSTFTWNIPEKYQSMNVIKHLQRAVENHFQTHGLTGEACRAYVDRVDQELELIKERGMEDFIRSMIYLIDVFRANNVVWGVGRGSSVESLVLFLIGVHKIDPVLYEIPLEHFFRVKQ